MCYLLCTLAVSLLILTTHAQNFGQPGAPPNPGGGISIGGDSGSISPQGNGINLGGNPQNSGINLGGNPASSGINLGGNPANSGINLGGNPANSGINLGGNPANSGINLGGNPANSGINLGGNPAGSGINLGGNPGGDGINLGGNPQGGNINFGGGSPVGPPVGPGVGTGIPTGGSPQVGGGGVIVVDNDGTIIPGPGTATDNVDANPGVPDNNANAGGRNNGFGPISFPDFSNFESIGNNFPSLPSGGNSNTGGGGGGGNLNSNIFGNPGFPNPSIPSFGNPNSNNNNPTPGGNINNNNNPINNNNINNNNNRFPDLSSINFDFGLGNGGAAAGFPSDFGAGGGLFPPFNGGSGFPGTGGNGGINLPPIDTNPGAGSGQVCQAPPSETLPVQVSSTPLPQNIVDAFFREAGARPEIQILATFFNTTLGEIPQPQVEDNSLACPANYSVLTKFVTSQNIECWVVPPPTQEPILFSQCRCTRCRTSSAVGRYTANTCKSKLSNVAVVAFCPLAQPLKILPIRIQIPTSCQCNLAQSNNRFILN